MTDPAECQTTWRLEDLFADESAFREAERDLRRLLPGLERWRGRLCESATTLAEALDGLCEAGKRLGRLRCFAALRSDRDTRDASHQAARHEIDLLATELSERISYVRPELLAADPAHLERLLAAEPRLGPHTFFVRDLIRQRVHVLGPPEERILAQAGLLSRAPVALFDTLHNVELPRARVHLADGTEIDLSPVEFHRYRSTPDREDRRRIFSEYFGSYARFRDTFANNLQSAVRWHVFHARSRAYPSCLAAALDPDHVPIAVYRNLIAQVRSGLPVLHRYFRLRARALGLERLEYHDLHGPLGRPAERRATIGEASRLVLESVAPIGTAYSATLGEAFRSRWIDWEPQPGKRAGAYATGWAYEVHPFVLLNFTGELQSVFTLAHEMGHALHSHYSNRAQPYPTANYSIFVAEVASTLNEALLSARLLEDAPEDGERTFLLATYLDGIRGTLYRQAMFAEFELAVHERAEAGEALTSDRLDALYLELLRSYHGHDEGVVEVDERYAAEWMAIPHFYYDFYVYQYATGIVAATALARDLLAGRAAAVSRYLEFLSAGGSDHPLALLRAAGVDLETSEPYEATFGSVAEHVEALAERIDAQPAGRTAP